MKKKFWIAAVFAAAATIAIVACSKDDDFPSNAGATAKTQQEVEDLAQFYVDSVMTSQEYEDFTASTKLMAQKLHGEIDGAPISSKSAFVAWVDNFPTRSTFADGQEAEDLWLECNQDALDLRERFDDFYKDLEECTAAEILVIIAPEIPVITGHQNECVDTCNSWVSGEIDAEYEEFADNMEDAFLWEQWWYQSIHEDHLQSIIEVYNMCLEPCEL